MNTTTVTVARSRRRSLFFVGFLGVITHLSVTMIKVTHIRDEYDMHVSNFGVDGSDATMLQNYAIETRKTPMRENSTKQKDEGMSSGMEQAETLSPSPPSSSNTKTNTFIDKFIDRFHRITIPDNNRRIAFLHIGKSGGSTISVLLRNGCMTAVDGIPCEPNRWMKIPNQTEETIVSKRILFYLHTPHVDSGNMTDYYQRITTVVVVARDPLERFISAFLARHPRNLDVARKRNRQIRALAEAKGMDPPVWSKPIWGDGDAEMDQESRAAYLVCFPSVDELALCADPVLDPSSSSSRVYNTTINWMKRGKRFSREVGFNCSETCRDVFTGKNKYIHHVRYNYEAFLKDLPPEAEVFVLRTTYLWEDWVDVNNILGATRDVVVPERGSDADVLNGRGILPVQNNLSPRGQGTICHFLKNDIRVYIDLLNRAVNLSNDDVRAALEVIHRNCPSVLSSLVN